MEHQIENRKANDVVVSKENYMGVGVAIAMAQWVNILA